MQVSIFEPPGAEAAPSSIGTVPGLISSVRCIIEKGSTMAGEEAIHLFDSRSHRQITI